MDRRKFIVGVGGAALGGSAILGSGAFSRIESQRSVSISVAEDPDAYLGLDKCDTPNGSYAHLDGKGHLELLMNEDNPHHPDDDLGAGVNSNSITYFDRVFQIRNQGKEPACVWIQDHEQWPRIGIEFPGEPGEPVEGNVALQPPRRVDFYLEDDRDRSIIGQENAVGLLVGESICVGMLTRTHGLSEDDVLLEEIDNEVVITADVGVECFPPVQTAEEGFYIEVFDDTTDGSSGDLDPAHGSIDTHTNGVIEIDLELTGGAGDAYLEKGYGATGVDLTDVDHIQVDIDFFPEDPQGVAYFAAVDADDLAGEIDENLDTDNIISAINRENLRDDGDTGHPDVENSGLLTAAIDDGDVAGSALKIPRTGSLITPGGASANFTAQEARDGELEDGDHWVILDVSAVGSNAVVALGCGQLSDKVANDVELRIENAEFDDGVSVFSLDDPGIAMSNPYRGFTH